MTKRILFFGQPCNLSCDGRCEKAWGINNRPSIRLSDHEDDIAYLADGELGEAPGDPGTYEGGHAKPEMRSETARVEGMNKWCARECERSGKTRPGEPIEIRDFSRRRYNIPSSDPALSRSN